MEACGGADFLGRTLREQGHEVRLIPAQYVKPYVKTNKSDYIDPPAILGKRQWSLQLPTTGLPDNDIGLNGRATGKTSRRTHYSWQGLVNASLTTGHVLHIFSFHHQFVVSAGFGESDPFAFRVET
jgi:hypothetical protein